MSQVMWDYQVGEKVLMRKGSILNLVGNVSDVLACVTTMPTLWARKQSTSNVANPVTRFMAGPCVGLHISAQLPSHSTTGNVTPTEIMVMFNKMMVPMRE